MADSKLTALPNVAFPTGDDLVYLIDDPLGAPTSNKATLDNIFAAMLGWQSGYTPQVDQGATTNISKTVTYSKYINVGKLCIYNFYLNMTAAGTSGSTITVTLPFTAASTNLIAGSCAWYSFTAGLTYTGVIGFNSTTKMQFSAHAASAGSHFGGTPTGALANNDVLTGSIMYETT